MIVQVECVFFGPLREPVGTKRVVRDVPAEATVESLLRALEASHEGLTFFEDGEVRGDRTITVDGKDVRHRDGLDTPLSDGDTVRMTTAVYGGRRR